jgi:hypothetical protein
MSGNTQRVSSTALGGQSRIGTRPVQHLDRTATTVRPSDVASSVCRRRSEVLLRDALHGAEVRTVVPPVSRSRRPKSSVLTPTSASGSQWSSRPAGRSTSPSAPEPPPRRARATSGPRGGRHRSDQLVVDQPPVAEVQPPQEPPTPVGSHLLLHGSGALEDASARPRRRRWSAEGGHPYALLLDTARRGTDHCPVRTRHRARRTHAHEQRSHRHRGFRSYGPCDGHRGAPTVVGARPRTATGARHPTPPRYGPVCRWAAAGRRCVRSVRSRTRDTGSGRRDRRAGDQRALPVGAQPSVRRRDRDGGGSGPEVEQPSGARLRRLPRRRVPHLGPTVRGAPAARALRGGLRGLRRQRSPLATAPTPCYGVSIEVAVAVWMTR